MDPNSSGILLTPHSGIGRLAHVDNESREERHEQPFASQEDSPRRQERADFPSEAPRSAQSDDREDRSGDRRSEKDRSDDFRSHEHHSDEPPSGEDRSPAQEGGGDFPPQQNQEGGGPLPPRGPRRGRRPPPRDRRGRGGRGRRGDRGDRGDRSTFQGGHPHAPGQAHTHPHDHGGSQPREREGREEFRDRPQTPQGSLIEQAKAEVDRIRTALERVLIELEEVSEYLTKAEHEKDIAEAEIEQLRDQLRRLHR